MVVQDAIVRYRMMWKRSFGTVLSVYDILCDVRNSRIDRRLRIFAFAIVVAPRRSSLLALEVPPKMFLLC
jgi:hypothetical protein